MRDTAVSSSYRTYGYDSRGNVTYDARGQQSFAYDDANQPTSVSGPVSGGHFYDGNLKRVKSTVGGKTRYFVYSAVAGNITRIEQTSPTAETTTYVRMGPVTAEFTGSQLKGFIHTDHQGSSVAFTTPSGLVDWREAYTPFGEELIDSAANDNKAGYTGHLMDDDTGLVYMQARYFDPVVGRFLSTDPIDYADQLNLYAYVGNDPVNMTDPTGEYGWTVFAAAAGALISGGAELVAQLSDDTPGVSLRRVAVSAVKGGVVGFVASTAGVGAASGVAATMGGVDGAVSTALDGGGAGEIATNAVSQALVEGGSTLLGGGATSAAMKRLGSDAAGRATSEVTGNVVSTASAVIGNTTAQQLPEVVDTLSQEIGDAADQVRAEYDNFVQNGIDKMRGATE